MSYGPDAAEDPGRHSGARRLRRLTVGIGILLIAVLGVIRVGASKLEPTAAVWREQTTNGTWRHMFDLNGLSAAWPLPLWTVALVGATIIGFPYAWICARALPDRGYGLSKVVGLMLVTWVTWWASSLRLVPFGQGSVVLAAAIVATGSATIALRHRREICDWMRANWRLVLAAEAVFWLIFAAALYVRWSNPDLWHPLRGGEKPMDFAYLNAVIKSTSFPPYDPWFGGGQMNYYYYGFVQVASLAKLTAIPPSIAYNLAIPTLAGLLGVGVYSAVLGFVSRARPTRGALAIGGFAALMVTVLGNLGEIRVLQIALHQQPANDWWFWNATRVIQPGEGEPGPISEFPAFTFIYGDLHAHAMALPLAALALALIVSLVRSVGRSLTVIAPCLVLVGLALGSLWVTNTWDLPTYALVAVCGIALATFLADRSRAAIVRFVVAVAGMIAVAYVAYLPFHLHFYSVFEGVQRWEGRQTRLFDYLTIHGLFLFAIASAFLMQLLFASDLSAPARRVRLMLRHPTRLGRFRALERALVRPHPLASAGPIVAALAVLVSLACAATAQWPAAVMVPFVALTVSTWPARAVRGATARDQALRRLLVLAVLVAAMLTIAVEYYVLRAIDIGRVNTVFKLYLQVWMLWGVAAGVSIWAVWGYRDRLAKRVWDGWTLVLAVLLMAASLYPIMATRAKLKDRFDTSVGPTLDGAAFMEKAVFNDKGKDMKLAYDRDAMRWMLEHVDGSPIVAEVNTAPTLYGWESRYSMFTGNPTIIGWDFHQRQQRPPMSAEVQQRVADVQEVYATTDPAAAYRILTRYGASYAVVGPLERAYFPKGTDKWEQGKGRYWSEAYSNPGVKIYRLESRDKAAAGTAGSS